jgi:uncharacterized membrane protein
MLNVWTVVASTAIQVTLAGVIGWLIHRLAGARNEFRQFLQEHEFLLTTARDNAAAIIKLNKRLDRMARNRG